MDLFSCIFQPLRGGIVSIVGAGGKTTLMFRLAHELAKAGQSVLTTTTTKIFRPTSAQSRHVLLTTDANQVIESFGRLPADGRHLTAVADEDDKSGKLIGYAPDTIDFFLEEWSFSVDHC